MELILAVVLGTLFGYVLTRVGATSKEKIIGMLTLTDLHLAKTIFTAIGLGSVLLWVGIATGVVDAGHLSIKSMTLGVVVGGALLGLGWAMSGMCPGTAVTRLGAGKRDAVAFVIGGLLGAGALTLSYPLFEQLGLFAPVWGGKTYLAFTPLLMLAAVAIGLGFMLAGRYLPSGLRRLG